MRIWPGMSGRVDVDQIGGASSGALKNGSLGGGRKSQINSKWQAPFCSLRLLPEPFLPEVRLWRWDVVAERRVSGRSSLRTEPHECIHGETQRMRLLENIVSIGTDLVSVDRIRGVIAKHGSRFLERVYTKREVAESSLSPIYFSGRFAVKEAVLKAMGTGLSAGLSWREIETTREPSGAPMVSLYGEAARRLFEMGGGRVMVSISHERSFALAFVLFLGESR